MDETEQTFVCGQCWHEAVLSPSSTWQMFEVEATDQNRAFSYLACPAGHYVMIYADRGELDLGIVTPPVE